MVFHNSLGLNTFTYITQMKEGSTMKLPYFYIIQHKVSKMLYAGSHWAKTADSEKFMTKNNYTTSSTIVNTIIDESGLDSFEIVQLLNERECGIDVYQYETLFLQRNNIAKRSNWLNQHNNDGFTSTAYGTEKFKNLMILFYGVEHALQNRELFQKLIDTTIERFNIYPAMNNPDVRSKFKNTMVERYGVEWAAHSAELLEARFKTNIEKFGNKCPLTHPEVAAKRKATWDKKYGENKTPLSSPEVMAKLILTCEERFGGHQMRNAEVLQARKQTNLDRYGFEEVTMSPIMKEKSKATLLEKYGVDNYSKTPERKKAISEMRKGSTVYNNGEVELTLFPDQPIPEGFIKGAFDRRKRTTEECTAMSKIRKGSTLWNDGERNYQVSIGNTPEPHWIKGKIKHAKVSNERNKNFGQTVWNDGTKQYVVKLGGFPEPHWIKGMLPRVKK
jgi:hypothetical protein